MQYTHSDVKLFLSPSDSAPMYQQIVNQITTKVMAGDWPAGQPLPSIRELASASQVSVITVKRAYAELSLAGVIVTRQGMGSFVADSPDLSTSLLQAEFTHHFDAMLVTGAQLGLSLKDIQRLLEDDQAVGPSDSKQGTTS